MPAVNNDTPDVTRLLSFARRQHQLNPQYRHPLDRRSEERRKVIAPATIRPVTHQLRPLAGPIDVVTRDISQSGIGLVLDEKPKHDYYTVKTTIGEEELYVLAMVIWCEPRGPFEFVGMEVVRRLH